MKSLIVIFVTLTSISAQASFYQQYCSAADGSVTSNNGHVSNKVTLQSYEQGIKTDMEFSSHDLNIDSNDKISIKEKNFSSCDEDGAHHGYASSDSYFTQTLKISKKNGESFPANTFGVSKDLKTVEAIVLCHLHFNSQVLCEN